MEKATNAAWMRIKNEKMILSLIKKAPISRADIAKRTGLTKAAVTIIVDDLKKRGIVTEQCGKSDTVGRNPVMLYLNRDAFYFIGVNITRFYIFVGITDLSGRVITEEQFPICTPRLAFPKIAASIASQLHKSKLDKEKIYKIGVVTPGPVDAERGVILNPPNFKAWHNVAIEEEMKTIADWDVVFENVSSATAVSEKYFGSARNTENFMALLVDEGIGSGIILSDTLFKGPCEFGHTSIKFNGVQCECGNRGCLEKYAAIPYILQGTGYQSWQALVDSGDDCLIEKEAAYLATAIISANNIFNFDKVVLCGDLTYAPDKIIQYVSGKVQNNMLFKNKLAICAGRLHAKCLIAASIAVHDLLS